MILIPEPSWLYSFACVAPFQPVQDLTATRVRTLAKTAGPVNSGTHVGFVDVVDVNVVLIVDVVETVVVILIWVELSMFSRLNHARVPKVNAGDKLTTPELKSLTIPGKVTLFDS